MGQTLFRDDERTYHHQTSCVQVFEHVDITERETWNALQERARKPCHAREFGVGVQSTLSVFSQ